MSTPPNSGGRRPDSPLPKGLVALPDDIPKETWLLWPRKLEAHLIWGLRERQVTAACTAKKIKQYMCNDQSIRLDPEELEMVFGPKGSAQAKGRLGHAGAPGAKKGGIGTDGEPIDIDDPYPALMMMLVAMFKDLREDNRAVLAMVIDPANQHVQNLLEDNGRKTQRITELENRWAQTQEQRGIELEQMRAFELEQQAMANRERRRQQIMTMLQAQVPALVAKYTGGPSVADFLDGIDETSIEALLASGFLSEAKQAQVRQAMAHIKAAKVASASKAAKQEQPGAPSAPNGSAAPQSAPS